jgi:hypothetical protein
MRYGQPLWSKTAGTQSLLHPENERQQNVNSFWFCKFGTQGITQIFTHRTLLLTALIPKNTKDQEQMQIPN